ncbi:MAG: SdpI family protein [Candidatus Eisenbacteria bacterium]|uniref:SdpI family protein n=1 Tax=Eiseniibacteriota bacterium TaxID=2212470 RepID=A0A7Y2ECD1_UNCEI|nr:SdpI family protein [Candidatus Eisenbacteria bacterium]
MTIDFGILRLVLFALLLPLGLILRFGSLPPSSGIGLGLPWTYADEEIWKRSNRRFGELLVGWSVWLLLQHFIGMPWEWIATLWAPLIITLVASLSYSASLYQRRYHTLRVIREDQPSKPFPKRGGWFVVVLREVLPLCALLIPILLVRSLYAELPDRIPIRWGLADGPIDWRWRDEALAFLRHQTMKIYLGLFFLESAYLLLKWVRGFRQSFAPVMLTRPHWFFFFFKLSWVVLFAGVNLGFVLHAAKGKPLSPFLVPGAILLMILGGLVAWDTHRATYVPPRKERVIGSK